ncbi:MAG: hypothetical protein QM784_10160 [Polyangiaceae bacterium]
MKHVWLDSFIDCKFVIFTCIGCFACSAGTDPLPSVGTGGGNSQSLGGGTSTSTLSSVSGSPSGGSSVGATLGGTSGVGGSASIGGATNTKGSQSTGGSAATGGSSAGTGSGGTPGTGGSAGTGGSTGITAPGTTADLVSITHADGWIPLFNDKNPPNWGTVVVGAWFDYQWTGAGCTLGFTKGKTKECFSGSGCSGTSPGAALGFSLCSFPGLDTSTWPQMKQFLSSRNLSTTGKSMYGFGDCNPGSKLTAVNWVGDVPAGVAVAFHDGADKTIGQTPVAAGATSVAIPSTIDGGSVASIHFVVNGSTFKTWNFCITKLTLSYE